MSPAQLSFNGSMEGKEDPSSSSLDNDMDDGIITPEKETSRYPTRSQPKTPLKSTDDHAVSTTNSGTKGHLKRKLEECWKENNRTNCNKEQATDSLEKCTSNNELPLTKSNSAGGTCPKCKEVFEDLHSFTLHIKKHNVDETTCGICSKKLSSASSLDRHMLTHTGEKPFKCKYCPQCFTTNGNMNRHMHIHELEVASRALVEKKKVKTSFCNQKSKTLEDDKKEKAPVGKDNVKASFSSKRMKTTIKKESEEISVNAKTTEIIDHPTVNVSPDCSPENEVVPVESKTESEPQLNSLPNSDAKIVTGFEDLVYMAFSSPKFCLVAKKACEETIRLPHSSEQSYECKTCKRIFPCSIALKKHEAFHQSSQSTVCYDCGCHFSSPQLLEQHTMKHHQSLKRNSDIGYAGFMAALGLHHKPKLLSPDPFSQENKEPDGSKTENSLSAHIGNTLSKTYMRPGWLAGNVSYQSPVKNLTVKEHVSDESGINSMEVEKNLEPTAENIILKQNKEYNVEKDAAPYCLVSSERNTDLPITKGTFIPIQDNIVQSCQQESSNDFADITSIISNVAATPRPSSERSTDLSETLHTESGSEADNHSIQTYAKISKKNALKVSRSGSKQLHSCSLCDYKSTEKSSLMRHMLTHDKERPFKCTLCQMTFTTKSNGERHAKTIHKLPKQELTSVIDYNLKISIADGKVKMCKYCDKVFENNRGLQHHLRSVTSSCSQKPFICGKCKRGCSTKNNCIRHFQNAHRDLLNELSAENAEGKKLQDFIIVNKHKKIREQQRKLIAASEAEAGANIGDSSNSESSSSESPSPMPQHDLEKECSFNDDDRVNAAEGLVSLSEGLNLSMGFESLPQVPAIEDSPLDLSVRAIDLSERKSVLQSQKQSVGHTVSESSSSFNDPQLFMLPSDATGTKNHELIDFSSFSTPLNLTTKQNLFCDISSISSVEGNTSMGITNLSAANFGSFSSTSKDNCISPIPQLKMSKSEIQHVCTYCDSKFTQKSNKDRHIRNFHPEHAKPRRNKNFAPSLSDKIFSKQTSSTLSDATREAILTRVLQHSDSNKQSQIENNHSMDIIIKQEPVEGVTSDLENVDLASVSSVINTANSPTFAQYLREDTNCNSYSQSTGTESTIEPPRKKIKISKADNDKPLSCDFPLCEKTFNCRSSLKRHSVIHTGERAFECHFCFKQFTTNSNMVRHITNKHKTGSSRHVISSSTSQSHWHTPSTSAGPVNLVCSSKYILREAGLQIKQDMGEMCVSPATRHEYPEPNHSPTLPETSPAAMPCTVGERPALECTFCSTTYKTEADRWNHMKQLHPLEYERMHGKNVNLPDIMSIWKKNGCAKHKKVNY